jgi:uncharacterized membrane protein
MFHKPLSSRRRQLRPSLDSLEGRALLTAAMSTHLDPVHVAAHVSLAKTESAHAALPHARDITDVTLDAGGGYRFRDFEGPTTRNVVATVAGTGANINGIANSGTAVGYTVGNDGTYLNFATNPLRSRTTRILDIKGSTTAMAYGINSAGTVVGSDGDGSAFTLSRRGALKTFIPTGGMSATALGINDGGTIVGQYVTSTATSGFIRVRGKTYVTVNGPTGSTMVSAQGINDKGRVVGFYVGADGQDHGLTVDARGMKRGTLTGTAIADPTIPQVAGETGATFVFSQVLGINDKGIAVGYYGDSTGSQHGFLYDSRTRHYTFLDDPSEAFCNGVEVTQITGITNSGEITGFYSDANGVFHAFAAIPHRA